MKKIILTLCGCIFSLQCLEASIYGELSDRFISRSEITNNNKTCIQNYESRMIKCLRCGEYHDSREKCKNAR